MPSNTVKAIEQYRGRLAQLEKTLHRELAQLPAKFGFKTPVEFVTAFSAATGGAKVAKTRVVGNGRKRRVKITPEIVAEVKKLVAAKKSGAEIAKSVGISLPSVQNIKTKLGLVRKRS